MAIYYKTGREIKAAVKKGTTWRTAVAVGALNGILITNDGMGAMEPIYIDDDSLGQADIKNTYLVAHALKGRSLEGYLRFEGWDLLFGLVFGSATNPAQLSGAAYSHTFVITDNNAEQFATYAVHKATTTYGVWEVPSAKFNGFKLSCNIGELAKVNFDFSGNKIDTVGAVNNSTSMGNVTYPTSANLCRMDTRFKMRMNAQAGAALADSDKIYPKGFIITFKRPMSEDEFEAGYSDMSEPIQNGFAEATIELKFDKYDADTFMTAILAETAYKMDILFEGDIIAAAYRYQLRIDIPKVQWKVTEAPATSPGKIPLSITGRCMAVDVAPTGFNGAAIDPFYLYVANTLTTNPLA